MKILFDLFPVFLFFGVFKIAGANQAAAFAFVQGNMTALISGGAITADQAPIMVATLVAMVASLLQLSYVKLTGKKIDMMLWVSVSVIVVFGGATIYLHDDNFIKWKPTIINWIYSAGMLIATLGFRKNVIRDMMAENMVLPDAAWERLNMAWLSFFFVLGLINLLAAFVIFKGDTSAWVNFKSFGLTGLSFVFAIGQSVYVARHAIEETKA